MKLYENLPEISLYSYSNQTSHYGIVTEHLDVCLVVLRCISWFLSYNTQEFFLKTFNDMTCINPLGQL